MLTTFNQIDVLLIDMNHYFCIKKIYVLTPNYFVPLILDWLYFPFRFWVKFSINAIMMNYQSVIEKKIHRDGADS